uniref:Uncharacterized protein n=1 Tax=Oryza barthii TaxID=65489 RepID=A0A0D3EMH6_9ORYZ
MDVAALFLPQSIAEQHVTEVVAITMTMPTSLLPARSRKDTQVNNKALRIKDIIMNYKEKAIYLTIYLSTQTVEVVPPLNKHRSPVICKIAHDLAE